VRKVLLAKDLTSERQHRRSTRSAFATIQEQKQFAQTYALLRLI
jgi:hypothetical protein